MSGAARWRTTALWGLALLPPLFLAAMYLRYSLDFPYWDQWEFVLFLRKYHAGELGWADFWAQHNEHRLVFPRLLMLGLALATDWNIYAELATNFLLGVCMFISVCACVYRCAKDPDARPIGVVLVSLCLFSLSQWQNWFLGWQLQEFLNVLAAVLAVHWLSDARGGWGRLAGALVAALVATYSFANGMLLWPVGLGVLWLAGGEQLRARVLVWVSVGVLVGASYLYGYQTPEAHPAPWEVWRYPLSFVAYAAAWLGQPLVAFHAGGAMLAGALGVAAWAVWLVRLRGRPDTAALRAWAWGLGGYALASALMTAAGRAEIGVEQAMSSRYVTLANPLWVALVVLGHAAWRRGHARRAAALALAVLFAASSLYGAYRWTERYSVYRSLRPALMTSGNPDDFRRLYPVDVPEGTPDLVERRDMLREMGLSVFRGGE